LGEELTGGPRLPASERRGKEAAVAHSSWASPGRERRGGGERKGARADGNWASRPKVRKGEGGKEFVFLFPKQFFKFIFKGFLNPFEFWIKTKHPNR
jgi:hypothetical protein